MNQPKSYLKWLLVILGVVILAAIGVYVFYVKSGNVGGVFSLSSPTPTKSAMVSPSAISATSPGSTKTSTPASGTTTSNGQPASSASSPQTPPSGWKSTSSQIWCAGPCYTTFSVFIKNGWQEHQNSTGHTPVFFTANNQCLPDSTLDMTNCYDDMMVSFSDPGNSNLITRSYPLGIVYNDQPSSQYSTIYVSVNKSFSSSDQNLIFDSFKVTR